jgi:hypothetical protein
MNLIKKNAKKIVGFGSCSVMGGVFGLAYQKGKNIRPLSVFTDARIEVPGCLGEIEELVEIVEKGEYEHKQALCKVCSRKSTCDYLSEIVRQIEITPDDESCFNDLGFLCNGYIARECKERCIAFGTPCRGCKPSVDRSGMRMLGMFGTLAGNVEVATEATGKGGTDKLADEDDDLTDSLPDVTGNFFRFSLADGILPPGRIGSAGNIYADIFTDRLIEELPLISGLIGGLNAVALSLDIINAYEKGTGITASDLTQQLRNALQNAENSLNEAVKNQDIQEYHNNEQEIRKIAGNMNLSNLFYGGFKTQIEGQEDFDSYKSSIFDVVAGEYKGDFVSYAIDDKGKVSAFQIEKEFLQKMEGK